ncbi:DNA glycosylase AlkZ-like family protein [Companilactobacillus mishanensis]|uniref:Winged helix DNA-binding domain-containing protein n=1 Tax=Companilactobacillus mishanensis TaxID=2486008 RepID=A0ABW9P700_9LACO|nr:crosslink repair DNA glycosylase YcaQ family protein [Companilactobacillus mishanensis]MQS45049.1 winged helix DNA-binding domain-containing protein [Companilactobacillus mishanensis]
MNSAELFAYRLYKHGILDQNDTAITPFTRVVGIQAQNQRAAELNATLQTGATQDELNSLFSDRKIIRSWSQRWTIHLMTPDDWRLVINARQKERLPNLYFLGMRDEVEPAAEFVYEILQDKKSLTRDVYEQLMTDKFAWFTGRPKNVDYSLFQLLASQGKMYMQANSNPRNFEMLLPDNFTGMNQVEATAELIKHYLDTFGPASIQDFVKWSGIKISNVRSAWKSIEPELNSIEVNNEKLWSPGLVAKDKLQEVMEQVSTNTYVAARFSSLMTGYVDKRWFIDKSLESKMWSKNGILMAPIIANGQIVGKWTYKLTSKKIKFIVSSWGDYNNRQLEKHFNKIAQFLQHEYDGITIE